MCCISQTNSEELWEWNYPRRRDLPFHRSAPDRHCHGECWNFKKRLELYKSLCLVVYVRLDTNVSLVRDSFIYINILFALKLLSHRKQLVIFRAFGYIKKHTQKGMKSLNISYFSADLMPSSWIICEQCRVNVLSQIVRYLIRPRLALGMRLD